MRLLFFGSPAFAVPSLRALHGAGHDIAQVVTQPDRPRGRKGTPQPTAVKLAASELGLDVFQPARASAPEAVEALRGKRADLGVVVAYGEILSPDLLSATTQGFLNVHSSLLPDYRGAAPINWAIMRGETETGVSVIRVVPELDAGPILVQRALAIGPDETAGELHDRLSVVGAEALVELVARLDAGEEVKGKPQPVSTGFFARKLTKADGAVDWSASAATICNRVRGLTPWPGAYAELQTAGRSIRVTLLRAQPVDCDDAEQGARPGEVVRSGEEGLFVKAGTGYVRISELKPSGSRAMSASDFVHGHHIESGDRFV